MLADTIKRATSRDKYLTSLKHFFTKYSVKIFTKSCKHFILYYSLQFQFIIIIVCVHCVYVNAGMHVEAEDNFYGSVFSFHHGF